MRRMRKEINVDKVMSWTMIIVLLLGVLMIMM